MQTRDSTVSVVTRLQVGVDSLSDKEAGLIYSSPERLWDQPSFLSDWYRELLPLIGHILRRNCLLKHGIEGKIRGNYINDGKTRKKR
jgi:hypothetical protein